MKIAEVVKDEFPLVPLLARAYDRGHAIDLVHAGVDFQIRETFESAMVFSRETLKALGEDEDLAAEVVEEFRDVDRERLELETIGGIYAGRQLIRGNAQPADLVAARTARERAEAEERQRLTQEEAS
ncbi:glutathione-regulated potassium-efflux system domain protein [Sinorhizobium sp. RAC02]|nr:glutathione-regulated potassium-efflux system domain protein [Sinorhizobium sp. RAC02]